ncbi:MAG TPA: thymidine phosphorylase family protein [Gemmatimonadaceae bacterium]|nr:thymidine phosphorylase family protein [Gemmatimonadaceae bacterium]
MTRAAHQEANVLRLKRLGIDTYQEPVLYMGRSCPICRSEGWAAQARVRVTFDGRSILATLNVVTGVLLADDEASLSDAAWTALGAPEGGLIALSHAPPVASLSSLRAKVYGVTLEAGAIDAIVRDVAAGAYSAIELAAFVTAFAGGRVTVAETIALTRAMVDTGNRLYWGRSPVVDKHCVGGLPGNRTSMIVVPIIAAAGLTIPKTSSRAITSPAGTADAMETVAPVDLDLAAMRRVVEHEGGCIVWGGRVRLSPADDIIIGVERPLDIDSTAQLVASVLSKKAAAGSTQVVIDVPIGPTAKIRSVEAADELEAMFDAVAADLGLMLHVVRTDGRQPVGRGIGPALEARDVLGVLRGDAEAPADLRARALTLAGVGLEMGGVAPAGTGADHAEALLVGGAALRKFEAICAAQGGMREPPRAALTYPVHATHAGRISGIDNRRLARIAKLAGAPDAAASGLELHVALGAHVEPGTALFTVHAETSGELDYARGYLTSNPQIIAVEEEEVNTP